MRPKTFLLLVVAVACGLVAAFAVNLLQKPSSADLVDVLVPKADIPPNVKFDAKIMFVAKPFPRALVPVNVITDPGKLEGRVAVRTMQANLPVTERDLVGAATIARDLEPGYRAMTVRASIESSIHGMLLPGARVDVLTVHRDAKNQPESRTFLQNIKILAVNTVADQPQDKHAVPNVASITMMVRPEQAQRLFLVSSRGQVGIALRKPGDNERVEVAAVSDPFGNEPESTPLVQVAIARKNIEPGIFIDRFDDYFVFLAVPRTQLLDAPILDRGQIERQRLTHFIARGQPAMPVNFLPIGVVAAETDFEQTLQNGKNTEVHKFRRGLPAPAKKAEPDEARIPGGEN